MNIFEKSVPKIQTEISGLPAERLQCGELLVDPQAPCCGARFLKTPVAKRLCKGAEQRLLCQFGRVVSRSPTDLLPSSSLKASGHVVGV